MIKTHTCYTAACDICGKEIDSYEGGIIHHPDIAEALSLAEDADWWTGDGDPDTTALCDTRDDAHLAKAREIAATLTGDTLETFGSYWPEVADAVVAEELSCDRLPADADD
jgi:hypothetical protein